MTLPPVTLAVDVILPVAVTTPAVTKLPPATLAVLVILPVAVTNPAVTKFPPVTLAVDVILPVAVTNPAVLMLAAAKFPVAVTKFEVLLNVKPKVELATPLSLNSTPVFGPDTIRLPLTLPLTLPINHEPDTLPVE